MFTRCVILIGLYSMFGSAFEAIAGDPNVPGFVVTTYVTVPDPAQLSFESTGVLYVGRNESVTAPTRIHRIEVGGASVSEWGSQDIGDPDSVFLDEAGVLGIAGSVYVGGISNQLPCGTATGAISEIAPDESVTTFFGPSNTLKNPSDMVYLLPYGLIITDGCNDETTVYATLGGGLTTLFDLPTGASPRYLVVDPDGGFFVSATDGVVRRYDGALTDVISGVGRAAIAIGPCNGAWSDDLYLITNNGSGQMLRVPPDNPGAAEIVGTGFGSEHRDMTFGPDGALYVSVTDENRILRIAPMLPPSVDINGDGKIDELDVAAFVAVLICDPLAQDDVCHSDINGDGNTNGLDIAPFIDEYLGA